MPRKLLSRLKANYFSLSESGVAQGGFQTLRDSVLTAIEIAEKAYKADGHVTGSHNRPYRFRP